MRTTAVAVLACCALALGACGSDGDDEGGRAQPLTKAQLIKRGDKICRKSNLRIEKASKGFADPEHPTQAEVVRAIRKVVVPELEGQVADLRALEPPAQDARTIDRMLDGVEAGIRNVRKRPQAIADPRLFAKPNLIATRYGFRVCGK